MLTFKNLNLSLNKFARPKNFFVIISRLIIGKARLTKMVILFFKFFLEKFD